MGIVMLQSGRTIVEFRKPSGKGKWTQGVVLALHRGKYYTVHCANGDVVCVHQTWMRTPRYAVDRRIRNFLRRKPTQAVDVDALNRAHMGEWMKRKGQDKYALANVLAKANEMWQKELKEERVRNPQPAEFWN